MVLDLAAKMEPAVARRFLAAAAKVADGVDMEALAASIEAGHVPDVMAVTGIETLADELAGMDKDLHKAAAGAGTVASAHLEAAGIDYPWERVNADAVAWAKEYSGKQITAITDQSRDAVRSIVEQVFTEPLTPDQAARAVRQVIGLSDVQAGALAKQRAKLTAGGASPSEIESAATGYTKEAIASRAETISRSEIMAASNKGQRMLWDGAKDAGLIDNKSAHREWIGGQENSCDECDEMDGNTADLDGDYDGPYSDGPPGHPSCECTEGLSFD